MLLIKSLKTKDLNTKNVKDICLLKNKQWTYSLQSQLNYFKKNFKKNDIHICIFEFDKLIAYNALRKKKIWLGNIKKNYFLFDTLIVSQNNRGRGLSTLIMIFNSLIIKENNLPGFLLCEYNLIKFYKKFGWVKKNKKRIKVINEKKTKSFMFFNVNILNNFNFNYKRSDIRIEI